jgi:hypothetical protein
MGTSGYYDEIAKVEAMRRQRLWRFRQRRTADGRDDHPDSSDRRRGRSLLHPLRRR